MKYRIEGSSSFLSPPSRVGERKAGGWDGGQTADSLYSQFYTGKQNKKRQGGGRVGQTTEATH